VKLTASIAVLRAAYPRQEFPDDTVRVYVRQLSDLDEDAVARAVDRLTKKSVFLPSIAEIRQEVAEEQLALPSASEAWEIAETGDLRNAPDEVRAATECVGGRYAILRSDNPSVIRAQFLKDYAMRRATSLLRVQGALPAVQIATRPYVPELEIPESARIKPRPVMHRLLQRMAGRELAEPSEAEKADAIDVLRDGPMPPDEGVPDALYEEAERIFVDASV
jgi:hypothetical protein